MFRIYCSKRFCTNKGEVMDKLDSIQKIIQSEEINCVKTVS